MSQRAGLIVAAGLALLLNVLSGCNVPGPHRVIPPDQLYAPPSIGPETAFIHGTQTKAIYPSDLTAYVRAVDDRQVADPRKNWDQHLPLAPGHRRITVVFARKGFNVVQPEELNVEAGKTYEIRFETKISPVNDGGYCDLWIADTATGKPVTETIRASAKGKIIPIFIPIPR